MNKEVGSGLLIRALAVQDAVIGDPRRFGPEAVGIVAAARRSGDTEALVVALRAEAWSERHRLESRRASRLLDEAARLADRAFLPQRLGDVLITRAAVNMDRGRVAAARRDLDRAADLVDGPSVPDLHLKRAAMSQNLGHVAEAAGVYRRILTDPRATIDVRTRAANNLALAESLRGHGREALRYIDLAGELAPTVGAGFVAIVAQNRGLVLAGSGRLTEGLAQFDRAVELLTAAGLPLGESYVELAETLAALRALPEAADLADRAVREFDEHDVPLMAAEARLASAEIALLRGDVVHAVGSASAAAVEFRRQRRVSWTAVALVVATQAAGRERALTGAEVGRVSRAAVTLHRLGAVSAAVRAGLVAGRGAAALGDRSRAVRLLLAAHAWSGRGPLLVRLQGRLAAALAAELGRDDAAVLRHSRVGLRDLAAHRSSLASTELRALAAGHGVELGLLGLGCLLRSGSPARVLDWAERTRAAALLTVEPPAPDIVREERAELAVVYGELLTERRRGGAEPAALVGRQTALEHRIRRATWRRSPDGAAAAAAARTAQLAAVLGERVLVSYGRYDDEMYAVVVDGLRRRRLVRLGPFGPVQAEGAAMQFALRRLTRPGPVAAVAAARAGAEHGLRRLADLLVQPLGIAPDRDLVIVPARDTHRLPWAALHPGPVSVAPSATLWAATAARPAVPPGRMVAVAGPGLSDAEHEARTVAACHRDATVLVPPASTAEAVLDTMAGAELVHVACHGHLRADNPLFSALEVSDGRLTLHELDLRGIAPRRVVLAACDSAADVSYDGDELVGFVGALLARGAVGVVASVVAVGDVEAVALMHHLHTGLAARMTMSAALHAARRQADTTDPRAFVNWCGFTAYGAG